MAESFGVSLLESGLWVIPLAILVVLVGLAVWIRTTERGIYLRLKPLLPRIQAASSALREIQTLSSHYTRVDREPFRSHGMELAARLGEAEGYANQLKQVYVHLQERLRIRHYRWWQLFLGAVFLWGEWQRISTETSRLQAAVEELEALVDDAWQSVQGMKHAGEELAQRVQDVRAAAAETGRLLDELVDRRLAGAPFEAAVAKDEAIADRLADIPEAFLRSDEDARQRQADTGLIADVFAILSEVQPELEALSLQLSAWVQEHQAARQAAAGAQARLDACQQQMAALPEILTTPRQAVRLKELEARSAALLRELGVANVERLKALAQEAAGLSREVEQVAAALRQGRRQFFSLATLLDEAASAQRQLIDAFTAAAKHARVPLQWEGGRERLVALNRQIGHLGPADKPREIDQAASQLEQTQKLRHEQGELQAWCQSVLDQQERLAGLLDRPQTALAVEIVQAGQAISRQVDLFAPGNWPRKDQVEILQSDLRTQESRLRSLLPAESPHSILESDLEDYLLSIEELLESQQALEERLASIEQRLQELRQMEQLARERLQGVRTVVSQVAGLSSGNELLAEISRTKIEAMRREAEQISQSLEQRRQGSMDKKSSGVDQLIEELERQAAAWLNRVNQDIETMKNELAEKVGRLQEIARLDDVEIERASSLLRQDIQVTVASKGRQEVRTNLAEIVPLLKSRNDLWQDCRIALAKLGERVEKPLVEAYQHAGEQRRHAQELLANVRTLTSGRRNWPPVSVSADELASEAERLEVRWREMRGQTVQAIWAVRRYGELAVAYRTLVERLSQVVRQAELDQKRIQALEAELSGLLRKWELLEHTLANDSAAVGRLRQLRSSTERKVQEVKRRWERESPTSPGGITYTQIQKILEELSYEIKRTRLLAGDESVGWREINIEGAVYPVAAPEHDSRSA